MHHGQKESWWRQCEALGNVELGSLGACHPCGRYDLQRCRTRSPVMATTFSNGCGLLQQDYAPSLPFFLGAHQWLWCWLHLQTPACWDVLDQPGGSVVPGLCVHVEMSSSKALKIGPKAASSVFECVRLLLDPDWLSYLLQGWKGECRSAIQRWPVKHCINTLHYLMRVQIQRWINTSLAYKFSKI